MRGKGPNLMNVRTVERGPPGPIHKVFENSRARNMPGEIKMFSSVTENSTRGDRSEPMSARFSNRKESQAYPIYSGIGSPQMATQNGTFG